MGSNPIGGTGLIGFDRLWKIKHQSVIVGSTIKADKTINAETEIAAAMADFDTEIAKILDAEFATV